MKNSNYLSVISFFVIMALICGLSGNSYAKSTNVHPRLLEKYSDRSVINFAQKAVTTNLSFNSSNFRQVIHSDDFTSSGYAQFMELLSRSTYIQSLKDFSITPTLSLLPGSRILNQYNRCSRNHWIVYIPFILNISQETPAAKMFFKQHNELHAYLKIIATKSKLGKNGLIIQDIIVTSKKVDPKLKQRNDEFKKTVVDIDTISKLFSPKRIGRIPLFILNEGSRVDCENKDNQVQWSPMYPDQEVIELFRQKASTSDSEIYKQIINRRSDARNIKFNSIVLLDKHMKKNTYSWLIQTILNNKYVVTAEIEQSSNSNGKSLVVKRIEIN